MTLSPPSPNLQGCVVVPARNEEDLVGACLRALAAQEDISHEEYEILLILDACTDGTEARAREVATAHPSLRLHLLDGMGEGSGYARRLGMETACARFLGLGRPDGLIASTDADTVVAPDWLAAQLAATERGARAIGGRIELSNDGSLPQALLDWHAERGRLRHLKLLSEPGLSGRTEHWQFSGASLALTAAVYREIGGLEPRAALEDEHLERVLHQRGIPIERLLSVRVTTSARLVGRAGQGLAHDLATAKLRAESQELP
jgi:glucosyl-3-phosphoglycerate synthase